MRVQLDATPQELSEKGEELIKALVRELAPVSPELAESLEKALPEKEPALKYRALRDIHKITKEEYAKTLERIHLDIAKVLSEAVENTSVGQVLEKAEGGERLGHKYIKREGTPGNYQYTYAEPVGQSVPGQANAPQATQTPTQPQGTANGVSPVAQQSQVAAPIAQPSAPVASEPASLSKLREQHGQLSPDEQRNAYFKDRNTGLLNDRGAELRQRDPQRPMTARFSMEGFKAFNDKFGHEAPDGALRLMGNELSQHIPDGVKRGGDIEGDVRDQAHADQIAERMSLAIDPSGRVKVTATAVKHGTDTSATLEKLGNAHKAHKDAEVEAGRLGHRMQHPAALGTDKARAHEAMRPIAARMQSMGPGKGAELNTEHHAQFAKLDPEDAFKTIHQEKSSGLLSDDGFKKSLALNPTHYVASADLRGVKAFNDAFGKKDTDSILRKFSELLTKVDGHSVHAAHPHGDEFMAHHEDPEKLQEMFSDLKDLTDKTILIKDMPNGKVVIQNGLHFAHGIGRTMDEADRINLPKAKEEQGDVQTPVTWDAEDGHREIERLREAGYSVFDVGRDLGEDVPRGKSEKGSEESSGAASAAPQQGVKQPTLPSMSGTPAKPKVRTPVKAKQNPEEAPLPGQRGLFNPQKVVARKPKQLGMFAEPPKPEKPKPTGNEPLPGQLPLIKSVASDSVQDIIDREGVAYKRVQAALIKRGYEAKDFEHGGVLSGKSTNELLGMVRSH